MTTVKITATRTVDGVAVSGSGTIEVLGAAAKRTKKGVGASKYLDAGNTNVAKLAALGVTWTYNWTTTTNPPAMGGIEYVPMVWGSSSATQARMQILIDGKNAGKWNTVLAFNEPDNAGQSNMTSDAAVSSWPLFQSTGLRLGSPAMASPNGMLNSSTTGKSWLDDFMTKANAKGYRVDFIALHYYVDWTDVDAGAKLEASLAAVYAKWGKPIWITELGTIDIAAGWGGHMDKPANWVDNVTYLRGVIPMLERLSYIERYAWFSDNKWDTSTVSTTARTFTSLYGPNDTLTDLGLAYQAT